MTHQSEWQLGCYYSLLQQYVRRLRLHPRLQRRFDSSDLVQETLLRAHGNRSSFRGTTEGELVNWLREILTNTVIDEVRKAQARRRNVALDRSLQEVSPDSGERLEFLLAAREASPDLLVEQREVRSRVDRALEQLPAVQRQVVILRDLMRHTLAEIAARLHRTPKAVACQLSRGRRRLRELLADLR